MATNEEIKQLLADNDMNRYYIRFNDHNFSNHMAHCIIALGRLGASKEIIQRAVDIEAARLRPASHGARDNQARFTNPTERKETSYYDYLAHYQVKYEAFHASNIHSLLREEFPRLSPRMYTEAFHALIQIGYGLAAGNDRTVIEGLAWIDYAEVEGGVKLRPLGNGERFGTGNKSPASILKVIALDPAIIAVGPRPASSFNGYLTRLTIGQSDSEQHIVSVMQRYVDDLDLSVDPHCGPVGQAQALVLLAITVYASVERPNDFFLLHGVTASWSLLQIIRYIDNDTDAQAAMRTFAIYFLATYIAQDCPKMLDAVLSDPELSDLPPWTDIIRKALGRDYENHIFKVTQVCHDMAKECPSYDKICRIAAVKSMKYNLVNRDAIIHAVAGAKLVD